MKIKILVVLVNYGVEQLSYLEKVVDELKSFRNYNVNIIVNSNIELNIANINEVNIYKLGDYQFLPLTCRNVIWRNRDNYDVFIYGENDHLFKETHIDRHLEYSKILPVNKVCGLLQYEENATGKYYPGYHLDFEWDFNSVEIHGHKVFAHFKNLHQASFILTKDQLKYVSKRINFTQLVDETPTLFNRMTRKLKSNFGLKVERKNKYSVKCKVNTDIYKYGGMKKLICISDFEDNLIHHLPNLYINGEQGRRKLRSSQERMDVALNRLLEN